MQDFLVTSVIASIVLTVLINVIPLFFPKSTQRVEKRIHDKLEETMRDQEAGRGPRVKVFFPWKTMLIISLALTVIVNLIGYLYR